MEGSGLTQAKAQPASCYQLFPFQIFTLTFQSGASRWIQYLIQSPDRNILIAKFCILQPSAIAKRFQGPFSYGTLLTNNLISLPITPPIQKNQEICTLACEFQPNNDLRALEAFRSNQQYSTTYGLTTDNFLNPKILLLFFSWPCRFSLLNTKILPLL